MARKYIAISYVVCVCGGGGGGGGRGIRKVCSGF